MKIHIDAIKAGVRNPHDIISIAWEVDGASGSSECEAWLGQHTIERLEASGYKIIDVALHARAQP